MTARYKTPLCLLLASTLLMPSGGCSFLRSGTEPITISASDPDAILYLDGKKLGRGPLTIEMKRDKSHTVRAMLPDGTGGATAEIRQEISWLGVIDAVLGYGGTIVLVTLPWLLGVFAPGYFDLTPSSVVVQIDPAGG